MELVEKGGVIKLIEGNLIFEVYQARDTDIKFQTNQPNTSFTLKLGSRNPKERICYDIFERLIYSIFGSYVLNEDEKKDYLPLNFVSILEKKIIWVSDSGQNNELHLKYGEKEIALTIVVNEKEINNNMVRIRTSGSSYGNYYQFFLKFYREFLLQTRQYQQLESFDNPSKGDEGSRVLK